MVSLQIIQFYLLNVKEIYIFYLYDGKRQELTLFDEHYCQDTLRKEKELLLNISRSLK